MSLRQALFEIQSHKIMRRNPNCEPLPPGLPSLVPIQSTDLHGWCERLGWRVTSSRLAILRAAQEMEGYLNADELVARAQQFDSGASRATVYRALPRLCATGLLRKIDVGEGPARFSRSSPGETPSAEIYVEDCGLILRVPAPFLTWYAESITERVGLKLTGQRLQTFARCSQKQIGGNCDHCPQIKEKAPAA